MKILKKSHGLFDVVVDGEVIGGGSMVEDEEGGKPYLERLDIDEEYRGKGYGTQVLHALRKVFGSYFLAPDNADAQRLYRRVADQLSNADYVRFGFAIDLGFGVYEM